MKIRAAEAADVDPLARIWHDGWQDAHARILPAELAKYRTFESFRQRLESALPDVYLACAGTRLLGFYMTKRDELYQLYVSREARGFGVAAALLADAEERIGARGAQIAWLACGIGNERAARFYEKNGWHRAGTMVSELPTPDGSFPLEVWRYEKRLGERSRAVMRLTPYWKRVLKIYAVLVTPVLAFFFTYIALHADRIFPSPGSVVIYGRDSCGFTTAMKDYLTEQGIPYAYGDVDRLFITQEMLHHLTSERNDEDPNYIYFPVVVVAGSVLERPSQIDVEARYRKAKPP